MANFGETLSAWAAAEPTIQGLVLIGSQTRANVDTVWRADLHSDWDFQVITSAPQMFASTAWTQRLAGFPLRAYASRTTRIGRVAKYGILFGGAEADLVILPAGKMRLMRFLTALGCHRQEGATRRALQDLAIIVRPGWKFLKGAVPWHSFYQKVVAEVPDPRLNDAAARELAACFWCDAIWTMRKVDRGEFLAAQRMLHQSLAETNFRLLHELSLRRGGRTFPEARRIERVAAADELTAVALSAVPSRESLREAVRKAGDTCDRFMRDLVGPNWQRPDLG